MSSDSHQQQQTQILQTCQRINQVLNLPQDQFNLQQVTHIKWYLKVLETIYPHLQKKFAQIKKIKNEAKAIDELLLMLTKEEVIEQDFLQIKGEDIINADSESIYYIVQLLNALIEREKGEENEEEEEEGSQNNEQNEIHDDDENMEDQQNESNVSQSKQKDPLSQNSPSPSKNTRNNNPNDPMSYKNPFNHYDSQDQNSPQEQRHSVLGINNQFEDQQEQQASQDHNEPAPINNKIFSPIHQINQIPKQQIHAANRNQSFDQQQNNGANKKSPFQNQQLVNSKYKNQANNLVQTGYKMQQKNKKKVFDSSEQEININKKKSFQKQNESEEEDENEYFINPTIKKHKSDAKIKSINNISKKSTSKKNVFGSAKTAVSTGNSRKLVSHPTVKKQLRKAINPQAKRLTNQVKNNVSSLINKNKTSQRLNIQNSTTHQMQRKRKQLKVKLSDWKRQRQSRNQHKQKSSNLQSRSNIEVGKILNWRQGQLKKEKQQFEKGMEMKLQVQKQNYIKKINNLIMKLEKQKQIQERNDYRDKLLKQNKDAAKRLTAIQQWYKDRIDMLKQKRNDNGKERFLMHTGHKQILKAIQKDLKRQNQKQIMAMTMKYRKNQAQIENDLEQLQRQIIKVYKKN